MKQILAICLTTIMLTIIPYTFESQIIHQSSGLCLDAKGGKIKDKTQIILSKCHGVPSQNWMSFNSGNGKWVFSLTDKKTIKVMDLSGGSLNNGAKVILYKSHGGDNQKWYWEGKTGSIINVKSGKCLDVSGNNAKEGLQLQQWGCNGSAAQRFYFR